MPSVWSCSPCIVLLLSAVVGREARATDVGKRHKDLLHKVDKVQAQITAFPKKRDATECPSSYGLCPASLDGGCCPPRYECATDACYATTAGTQSACGLEGYYNCGISAGGGCCPEGGPPWVYSSLMVHRLTDAVRLYMRQRQLHPTSGCLERADELSGQILPMSVILQLWLLYVWVRVWNERLLCDDAVDDNVHT
jgi:hypothetical protein